MLQDNFGGGIYRGRRAPASAVYDAINALIDGEGQLYRRGNDAYYSSSDAGLTLISAGAYYMPIPQAVRVFAWRTIARVLDGALAPTSVTLPVSADRRPAQVGNFLVWPINTGSGQYTLYGGSLKSNNYSTGTATFTNGSKAVTGAGTAWLANVDVGMVIAPDASGRSAVVKAVVNDTSITLADPWPDVTATGVAYTATPSRAVVWNTLSRGVGTRVTAAGSGTPRLVFVTGNRAYLSDVADPTSLGLNTNTYLELPAGAVITGAEGYGDSCFFFTDTGVWRADNLSLDAVDDIGNQQWTQQRINGALRLWGENGIASWGHRLVVPAADDVFLMAPDGSVEGVSGDARNAKIRSIYRSYVASGYTPGTAAVWNGHYVLPVFSGSSWIDTLICRLDRGAVWTRWSGHAAGTGFAVMPGAPAKLLCATGQRVADATGCFSSPASSAQDADGTTPAFTVVSNDIDLGPGIRPDTAEKVRYVYETAGGTPTITVSHAVGAEGASYTAATLKRGGGVSDGTDYSAWRVGRKAERIRFRFTTSSAVTSLILRRMEVTIRQAGQT
jgi:hypothetical protein